MSLKFDIDIDFADRERILKLGIEIQEKTGIKPVCKINDKFQLQIASGQLTAKVLDKGN